MLDWIFEGIANWVASVMTQIMDAISGVFLDALGTDMTAMEEYFPFAVSAYTVIQYTAWAVLFLVVVWQLFRAFSGPLSETEEPLALLARGAIFAILIGYAKPIFSLVLDIGTERLIQRSWKRLWTRATLHLRESSRLLPMGWLPSYL